METKTVTELEYNEFDNLVHKYFPLQKEFTIVADEELNNYSVHDFGRIEKIEFYRNLVGNDLDKFIKFMKGENVNYVSWLLVRFLVCIEEIPEGNVQVKVYW